jgi:hypothetical protein
MMSTIAAAVLFVTSATFTAATGMIDFTLNFFFDKLSDDYRLFAGFRGVCSTRAVNLVDDSTACREAANPCSVFTYPDTDKDLSSIQHCSCQRAIWRMLCHSVQAELTSHRSARVRTHSLANRRAPLHEKRAFVCLEKQRRPIIWFSLNTHV